ncbi:phospholipase A I-like [Olea europaea var. sylvestris]|uniref:Phospholipase A I n=1 Tax=Olea europaea subsp. europaea TaxID=158383 RepID=A0A8S0PV55_OLEEU|nr:phospholipase A I-like [Olea europaea var. sylvestris]CAA2958831.1 phospholipase A I [Olea europaea subsp. europaea]
MPRLSVASIHFSVVEDNLEIVTDSPTSRLLNPSLRKILKEIEKGTVKQIHELFDLSCGTSTGRMFTVALGIKLISLEKCEETYKKLGKLIFAEPIPKGDEAASWREKLDKLYKSSSQSFSVDVHRSKHSADQFERLLGKICADKDGDLLIESSYNLLFGKLDLRCLFEEYFEEARHFSIKIRLKPVDDVHVDLVAAVAGY